MVLARDGLKIEGIYKNEEVYCSVAIADGMFLIASYEYHTWGCGASAGWRR